MRHIAVIGGGTMGNGIVHTAAATGFDVISANLQRGVDKGKMKPEEKQAVLGGIKPTTDIRQAAAAGIVVEDRREPRSEDTSSISITRLAAATRPAGQGHRRRRRVSKYAA